jgi:hypothetical protein
VHAGALLCRNIPDQFTHIADFGEIVFITIVRRVIIVERSIIRSGFGQFISTQHVGLLP